MSYTDNNSYEEILQRCLSKSSLDEMDKRPGSVIYDALAPVCMELAEAYMQMEILSSQTHIMTATENNLEDFGYSYGLFREAATYAQLTGKFQKYATDDKGNYLLDEDKNKILVDMDIPINSRFINTDNVSYVYIGKENGLNILRCEQAGNVGNSYVGAIIPLQVIPDLVNSNLISVYISARDKETDTEFRQRIQDLLSKRTFGGNIQDYIQRVKEIEGVGNAKVFPHWSFPGSVLLSVVSEDYKPISDDLVTAIKEEIDPDEYTGQGVGTAPIGHYVTITTPVKREIDISCTLVLENDYTIDNVFSEITGYLEDYFDSLRHKFNQRVTIIVYLSKIIDYIYKCNKVINVTNVLIDNDTADIELPDTAGINKQFLPYIGSIRFA